MNSNRVVVVVVALGLSACSEQLASFSRTTPADLCDLASDRTIETIQHATLLSIGPRQTVQVRYETTSGQLEASLATLSVARTLRGTSVEEVWLSDRVLSNGASYYGNLLEHTAGLFFIRNTGGIRIVPVDGFFYPTTDGAVANHYRYANGLPLAEVEQTITTTPPGTACPNDATVPRFDQQFESADAGQ